MGTLRVRLRSRSRGRIPVGEPSVLGCDGTLYMGSVIFCNILPTTSIMSATTEELIALKIWSLLGYTHNPSHYSINFRKPTIDRGQKINSNSAHQNTQC